MSKNPMQDMIDFMLNDQRRRELEIFNGLSHLPSGTPNVGNDVISGMMMIFLIEAAERIINKEKNSISPENIDDLKNIFSDRYKKMREKLGLDFNFQFKTELKKKNLPFFYEDGTHV